MPAESWTVPACAENIATVRRLVADFAAREGVPEARLVDVRLAVSEAFTNAVMHGFRDVPHAGTVIVGVDLRAHGLEVRIADDGSGMAPRDDSPGLGLGLPLIRHLADQFDYGRPRDADGTELRMWFGLDGRAAA